MKKTRKKYDNSQWTKSVYSTVLACYEQYKAKQLEGIKNLQELTIHLNQLLNQTKTRNTYARVWLGKISIEELS